MGKYVHTGFIVVGVFLTTLSVMADQLKEAVVAGDISRVKLLVKEGADVNGMDAYGHAPLHWAASREDREDIALILISKGADINARDMEGRTPLHKAAFFARRELSELLISNGADITIKSKLGYTPLHSSAGACNPINFAMAMFGMPLEH